MPSLLSSSLLTTCRQPIIKKRCTFNLPRWYSSLQLPETRTDCSDGERVLRLRSVPIRDSSTSFYSLENKPALLRPSETYRNSHDALSAAQQFMRALREGREERVELELGTYDNVLTGDFDRFLLPLSQYLDWLESTQSGRVDGRQAYMAQNINLQDNIPALREFVKPPAPLQMLFDEKSVDQYPTAMFVGPTHAISPFHIDPYMNLFHLQASSDPDKYAKHVVLIPPELSHLMTTNRRGNVLPNTSGCRLTLRRVRQDEGGGTRGEFEVLADPETVSHDAHEALAQHAMACVVREGETLFIPKGWWHRVENVCLVDRKSDDGPVGWTAAVAWWFLPRTRAPRS